MPMSKRTKDIISFFLCWVRDRSLAVSLAIIMTDWDLVQIGALKIMYLDSWIFLCKWHVLCIMQTCFNACEFLELWIKVRSLVSILDEKEFNKLWSEILNDPKCPKSFAEYIKHELSFDLS
jgi:hypothetical protein